MKRITSELIFTKKEKENFRIFMDREFPEVRFNRKGFVKCNCGQCHWEFVKEYIKFLAINN